MRQKTSMEETLTYFTKCSNLKTPKYKWFHLKSCLYETAVDWQKNFKKTRVKVFILQKKGPYDWCNNMTLLDCLFLLLLYWGITLQVFRLKISVLHHHLSLHSRLREKKRTQLTNQITGKPQLSDFEHIKV